MPVTHRTFFSPSLAGFALLVSAMPGRAQTAQVPYALFDYSTVTASGNTITASQVPVVISPSVTVYVNLKIQFAVDNNGNITIAPGYPQVAPTPALLSGSFRAGTYVGPSPIANGKSVVVIAGPGVTDGGATEWSLTTALGADTGTYPTTATWYVGPLATSPFAARLKAAGITSSAWSYGTSTTSYSSFNWAANTLIGLSQVGSTITVVSFTAGGRDYSTPVDQITFTLKP